MSRNLKVRWVVLILVVEMALLFSFFSIDALIGFLRHPFHPLAMLKESPILSATPKKTPPVIKRSPLVILRAAPSKPAENYKTLLECLFQSDSDLKRWEEKIFKGGTTYELLSDAEGGYLRSVSAASCSGLYIQMEYPVTEDLYVSWKWKAVNFPKKKIAGVISDKNEDDYAARVYVIFQGANFFKSDVIEYVWDESMLVGTVEKSPYSDRIKLYVLRSGQDAEWAHEERNVYEDYQKVYGRLPEKPLGAVALMSDSDNTGTNSEAYFGEIKVKQKLKPEIKRAL